MQIGLLGLGKMGKRMAQRLARNGHQVVVYNRTTEKALDLAKAEKNIAAATSLQEFAEKLQKPRVGWSMVPAGPVTNDFIAELMEVFDEGDFIIDGANSNYKDTIQLAKTVTENGFHFMDVGVSGGIWGLEEGYGLMIGGKVETAEHLRPIFESLAPDAEHGWGHVGPYGAGHFVKMVHNGIEYGMMQAYAEGFDILNAKKEFDLDLHQVAEVWRYGTVIRSWLLDLTANALSNEEELKSVKAYVEDSGEGRWTVFESIAQDVPAPVITMALLMRLTSRQDDSFAFKLLASMRNQFGGHAVRSIDSGK